MPDTPNYGRYTEIPYDQMTPEQQEGYRSLIETRGQLGGPSRIWVHNPKLAKVAGAFGAHFHAGRYSITEREREILDLIAQGRNNAQIATQLVLSPHTVRNYVSSIFSKLQVADRAHAIIRGREAGLG